ncbi:murein biosynthesis integral membrane protein MurJ [Candidatus Woesebacteria bacterium]|nr:murein biosynthesis integral membrane protein MurJ [Candidatus Woesebacteria bacterium]
MSIVRNYTNNPEVAQMVGRFFKNGSSLLYGKQANILSAATVIMVMIAVSRLLGLLRNRTFVHFFPPEELDTFFAAFQLPDLIFEILVLGAMSSAFIPVFSSLLGRGKEKEAWRVAGITLNLLFLFFLVLAVLIFSFANPIYTLVAQGFSPEKIEQTVAFARILIFGQLFFVASYLLTGTLESNQRFLAPASAPLFYNLSIIISTILFAPTLGLYAPIWGAVAGSALHLLVQLPLALKLGFRPIWSLDISNPGVRAIGKLALPRIFELSFFQLKNFTDLFLASLVVGGLTYFKFGNALAALPIGLFGLSIAKASFPQLSKQAAKQDMQSFKFTFASSFKEILFLVVPASIFLAVLRIPAVRLAFGGEQFGWEDTVQTGYVLSAFAVGIFAYSVALLVSRAFYSLHDTKTPVKISILTIFLNVGLALLLIMVLKLPIWGLALAYAIAGIVQIIIIFTLLSKKVGGFPGLGLGKAFTKILVAGGVAGSVMFFLLKILDRSVWDKNLSFLAHLGIGLPITFDKFVLDTRYTTNLIFLTAVVAAIGFVIYVFIAYLLRVEELSIISRALRKISRGKIRIFRKLDGKDGEPIAPHHTNGT